MYFNVLGKYAFCGRPYFTLPIYKFHFIHYEDIHWLGYIILVLYVCILEILGRINISGHGHPQWNDNEWLWWPNDVRGPCGPKASWHSSYRWGKTPKKPHLGNLSRPRIEPRPAAWQACMLPLAPQRWTWMIMDDNDGQMIVGDLGGLKLPDIRLTDEEKPRKNLTQETCSDRESNPGALRGKRACYYLPHSGGLQYYFRESWIEIRIGERFDSGLVYVSQWPNG